jgi:urea transport system substrate-binding protein
MKQNQDRFHPVPDRLRAFSLGHLSDEDSEAIESHLAHCPYCSEVLTGLDDEDTFQSALKSLGRKDSQKAESLQVPPALQNHARYQVVGVLGSGGMGTVFKAEHRWLDRPVVIKIIHPELVRDPELVQRFQREARLAAKLSHPNVVGVYEAEQLGQTYLLVMEFIDGENLSEVMHKRGTLPVGMACELARQASLGLQHIHERGLIHRDIKPANLMLTNGGQLKVLDLGLAFRKASTEHSRELTMTQQSMGTVDYMAPEQWLDSHEVDIRADIYSLGCTLYYFLTGSPPFAASKSSNAMRKMYAHSVDPVPPIRDKRPEVPVELAAVIKRMLAKNRNERYAVPAEVAKALEPFAKASEWSDLPGTSTPTTLDRVPSAPASSKTRHRSVKGFGNAAVFALLVLAIGFGWQLYNQPDEGNPPAMVPSGPPIKVGVLHSLSGTMAISEKPVVDATLLAIKEINENGGVLGRPVEAIVEDGASDGPTFARLAEKLITEDKVSSVFGCWTSSSRKSVRPIVEKHDHLLFYPVQYEGLEQSPNIIYLGAAPNQQILPAVEWCCSYLKKKRLFLVGSDYVFPRCANEIIRLQAKDLGGQVVGEEYLLLGSHDVKHVIDKIAEAQPDIILNTINGDTNVSFFRALRARGITSEAIPTISFSIAEEELTTLDASDLVGEYAAWNYFMSIDHPKNHAFIERFQAAYGKHRVTTDPMEAAYVGVHLWAKAVEAAGRTDVSAVREAVKGQTFDAPEGPIRIDPATQHTYKKVRIGKILADRRFKVVFTSESPIMPVPYPPSQPQHVWDEFVLKLNLGWGGKWRNPGTEP